MWLLLNALTIWNWTDGLVKSDGWEMPGFAWQYIFGCYSLNINMWMCLVILYGFKDSVFIGQCCLPEKTGLSVLRWILFYKENQHHPELIFKIAQLYSNNYMALFLITKYYSATQLLQTRYRVRKERDAKSCKLHLHWTIVQLCELHPKISFMLHNF